MNKYNINDFLYNEINTLLALQNELKSLSSDYPASAIVNFFYLKVIQENCPKDFDKKKAKLLLSLTNRQFFYQTQFDFSVPKSISEKIENIEVKTKNFDEPQEPVSIDQKKEEISEVENKEVSVVEKKELGVLIDTFSVNPPKIMFNSELHDPNANFAEDSCKEDPEIISETLAMVYAEQGYTGKAEKILKKLCLHFPEKSSYFADQIKKIKNQEINQ